MLKKEVFYMVDAKGNPPNKLELHAVDRTLAVYFSE